MSFWTRRIIYIVFAIALSIPLVTHWVVPPDVGPEALQMYNAIEKVPPDKLILLSQNYEPSTIAENGPQTRALIVHMMERGKRFAIIGWDPVGPDLGEQAAQELSKTFHKPYGETWCNLGYNLGTAAIIKGMARDLPGTIKRDAHNTLISSIPCMKGIKGAQDIGMVIDVTPAATYTGWIGFFTGPYHVPFAVAPTSVMISDLYPFLNSGQLVGMLKGIAGAAQYEKLVDYEKVVGHKGEGYVNRMPVFMAHITIILLILWGNVLEIRKRRALRQEGAA